MCTVPATITCLYILKKHERTLKFYQTTRHNHIMKSNAIWIIRRSNPAFIAAENLSFHFIRVGWSSLLNENSWVQIFWEAFSKNGPYCITRVSIQLSVRRSLLSPRGWSTWSWSSQPSAVYSPAGHSPACSTGGANKHTVNTTEYATTWNTEILSVWLQ